MSKERFLDFIEKRSHDADNLAATVTKLIEDTGLMIGNLRRQSYDNAANMAGAYTGLHTRINYINSVAHFVPCAAHSLNVVGTSATESCLDAVLSIFFLHGLYIFLFQYIN